MAMILDKICAAKRISRNTTTRSLSTCSSSRTSYYNNSDTLTLLIAASAVASTVVTTAQQSSGTDDNSNQNTNITKTETISATAPHTGWDPSNFQTHPKNVMLHRMRSIRARNMDEKYNVDWQKVLGEGAYGSVHAARLAATNEKVALKKITKRYTNSSTFLTETNALLRIYDNGGHPNISGLRDMYEDFGHYYLILDLVSGGELFDHLINFGAYSEADAARLMQEVASALAFLHNVGVVHADLKPENLLLCSKKRGDGTVKLIDFGCAIVAQDDDDDDEDDPLRQKITQVKQGGSTGTTAYWSPERFIKGSDATSASDMWAIGVILYIMLTGVHPFDLTGTSTDDDIERQIKKNPSPPIGPLTAHLSPSAVDLILKLMDPNPKRRLTAEQTFQHPWIRGETATTAIMADSDKKLSRFKELRDKLEAGIFAVLVSHGHGDQFLSEFRSNETKKENERDGTDIMKRAFDAFDAQHTGLVTSTDLGNMLTKLTGDSYSENDLEDMITATLGPQGINNVDTTGQAGLSLSDFSKVFSRIKHKYFPRGHVIFHAGDEGDAMYFINAGRVEIRTRKGHLISILKPGDFFGEGSLLEDCNVRMTTARCATPVDLIKIKKEEFDKYVASNSSTKTELKTKWKARSLTYAKNLLRMQTNVKTTTYKKGDVVYKEGDVGKSIFFVDDKNGGRLDVTHGGNYVHSYESGDNFGESSILFTRPHSSTVVCASQTCKLHEMLGSDFLAVLESSPETASSLRNMCRKRLFKRAIKALSRKHNRGYEVEDIMHAFHKADTDGNGSLSLSELRQVMRNMDPNFPEEEIVAILKFIDVDEDGNCGLDDFMKLFRTFEIAKRKDQKTNGGKQH
eukprot:CAMPEP_0172512878 /NCGR_PEP_ID=MMETSP1066-20121228/247823_1 /TAXON_ID=671091 /ORGANISM="Coscinodiscus wailesii, Strain CCMP2513" /LENGTH=855 /DNA_ID=CAMNT_0013292863 /DNA_START=105 /DNA_END=2672 /DNA_ORIENTATION=-